jgi:hypothetical protein
MEQRLYRVIRPLFFVGMSGMGKVLFIMLVILQN